MDNFGYNDNGEPPKNNNTWKDSSMTNVPLDSGASNGIPGYEKLLIT